MKVEICPQSNFTSKRQKCRMHNISAFFERLYRIDLQHTSYFISFSDSSFPNNTGFSASSPDPFANGTRER